MIRSGRQLLLTRRRDKCMQNVSGDYGAQRGMGMGKAHGTLGFKGV